MSVLEKNMELIKKEIKNYIVIVEQKVSIYMRNYKKYEKQINEMNEVIHGMNLFLNTIDNFMLDDMIIPNVMMDFSYLSYWILCINVSDDERFDTLMEIIKRNYNLITDDDKPLIFVSKEDNLFINRYPEMQAIFDNGKKVSKLFNKYHSKKELTEVENKLIQILIKQPSVFERKFKLTTKLIYSKYLKHMDCYTIEDVSSIMDVLKIMGISEDLLLIAKKHLLREIKRCEKKSKVSLPTTSIKVNNRPKKNRILINDEEYRQIKRKLKLDINTYNLHPKRSLTLEEQIEVGRELLLINKTKDEVESFFALARLDSRYLDIEHTVKKSAKQFFEENYARYEFYSGSFDVEDIIDNINIAIEFLEEEIDDQLRKDLEDEIEKRVDSLENLLCGFYKYEFEKIKQKDNIFIKK